MTLEPFLLALLVDPVDHGPLLYLASDAVLYNPRRHIVYDVRGSIPVLLADEAREATDDEHAAYLANPEARSTGPAS